MKMIISPIEPKVRVLCAHLMRTCGGLYCRRCRCGLDSSSTAHILKCDRREVMDISLLSLKIMSGFFMGFHIVREWNSISRPTSKIAFEKVVWIMLDMASSTIYFLHALLQTV